MSLRLIYGRAGHGKSSLCMEEIKDRLDNNAGNNLILIVPEQVSFQAEKNLIEKIKVTGVKNVSIFSFKRMAYTVFKQVGGITRKHMNSSGKNMLIYRIMEQMREELMVFGTAAKQQGFVNTIATIISELKRYNVTPELLNEVKEKIGDNSLLYNKVSDISSIFENFQNALHMNHIDSDDDLTILREKIDESTMFDGAEIWIDEFNGFIPQQYAIIEKLLQKAKRVNITLNMSYENSGKEFEGSDAFSPVKFTENRLIDLAEKIGSALDKPVDLNIRTENRFSESRELAYLEKNYFTFPFKPYKERTDRIKLFKALNVYSEIENTAADILKLCRDENVRFNEIAVITRDLDRYEKIVKVVFSEYNIPYFIDKKQDITSNPIIILIISALEIMVKNWSYEAVFRYLKTGLLDINKNDIDLLENYIMEFGIKGKKKWLDDDVWYSRLISSFNLDKLFEKVYEEQNLEGMINEEEIISIIRDDEEFRIENILKNNVNESIIQNNKIELQELDFNDSSTGEYIGGEITNDKIESENVKKLNETLEKIRKINFARKITIKNLSKFHERVKTKKTTREICTELFNFLCDLRIYEKIEERIDGFKEAKNQELANEYSQIWNVLIELMDQMVEVLGDDKFGIDEFAKIVSMGLAEHKMGFIPTSLDQVIVSSVDRFKSDEIKYLYIIGVNDGIFPSATNEEGILTDLDRQSLKMEGVELAKDTKTQAFEEQFLIYTTLTIAGKYLRVSYPIADHEGKTLRPSIIISRLRSLFPNMIEESNLVQRDGVENDIKHVTSEIPTFNQLISQLKNEIEKETISPIWENVYKWYNSHEQWKYDLQNVLKGFSYTNQVGKLDKNKVQCLYGDNKYFSVSKIERYLQCPFAYFVNYGLKAKERKIFNLSAPDIGSFMHNVIEKFSKAVDENKLEWKQLSEEWCRRAIEEKVEEEISETKGSIFANSPRYRHYAERLKRVLTRTIWLLVEHMKRSGFEPLGYEVEFGVGSEGYPPIEIELSTGEKVKLIGKIDRIDKLVVNEDEYFRIIDYKSGSKEFKLSDVYYGLQMQLLTYLDAILETESRWGKYPIFPAGVLYFKIDDPMLKKSKRLSEDEIEREIMKELKMKGLVLADTEIIKEMDNRIEGASLIIPAELKKDGNISSRSHAATKEQFEQLRQHVRKNLQRACEQMLEGDIQIRPYKKKEASPCTFCVYTPICQFDPLMKDNNYNNIQDIKDKEVWELISKESEDKNNDEEGIKNGRG